MALTESTGTGAGRSSFAQHFKDQYLPSAYDVLFKDTVLADLIAKRRGGVMYGKRTLGDAITQYPQSAGIAFLEYAQLEEPSTGTSVNPVLYARAIHNRLRITGHLERATRRGKVASFVPPKEQDIMDAEKQMQLNFERMLHLGPYQILAMVNGAPSGNTVTLHGRNSRTSLAADLWKHGAHFLRNNMRVAYSATVSGAPRCLATGTRLGDQNASTVTAIDESNISSPTASFSTPTVTATLPSDGDFVFPFASRRDAPTATNDSDYAGPNGLRNMLDDASIHTTIYELTRSGSSNPKFRGKRMYAGTQGSTRAFSDRQIELGIDLVIEGGNGDEPDSLYMNRAMRREASKEHAGDRWFPAVQTESGIGKLAYRYGERTYDYRVSFQCPPGDVWILNTDSFEWLTESELQPADGQLERFVANADEREMITVFSGNCWTRQPSLSGVVEDLSYSVSEVTA